MSPLIGLFYFI